MYQGIVETCLLCFVPVKFAEAVTCIKQPPVLISHLY
jgi:hypothetical protein